MRLAQAFAQTGFARFINSAAGRLARVLAGVALLVWGFAERGTGTGIALMAIGLIPLVAGLLDWCLISALLGGPLSGATLRQNNPDR